MKTEYSSTLTRWDSEENLFRDRINMLNKKAADGWTLVTTVSSGFDGREYQGRYLDTFVRTR